MSGALERRSTARPPRMRKLFWVDLFLLLSFLLVSGRFGPPGACPAASDRRALLYVQLPQSAYQNW
jgi:hypothetical protein